MKSYKTFITTSFLAIIITFSSFVITFGSNTIQQKDEQIIIYHTNDTHGYVNGDEKTIIGIDKVAALKESTENSILVDAGDATQGLPIASITKGSDIIELMNIAGYDLMVAGNHEFDFGKDNFLNNVKKANFPIIAANIYENDKLFLKDIQPENKGCHTIIEKNGIKIGFFGLTTIQTAKATNPEGIKGLEFKDEVETAKKEIDELKSENVDVIIAVCHMGNGDAPCTSSKLAQAMDGEYHGQIDVIIDGHSHTIENNIENDILIVQTGYGFSAIGKLTLNIKDNDVYVSEELLKPEDLSNINPKDDVKEKLDKINKSQSELLKEVICKTPTTLWAGWIGDIAPTRLIETNYGDLATDAYKYAAEKFLNNGMPIVAIENGGGIREAAINGDITKGTLISAFPFSNTLYIKEITPKILYDVMEISGKELDGQDSKTGMLLQKNISGGFLQLSGCTVVFNPNGNDYKVTSITLDGQSNPLERNDEKTKIILVGNNFIMNGGNDYTMLGELPKYGEIGGELETIQNYILNSLNKGILDNYSGIKNRIVMAGDYLPKNYIASINIIDENGKAVKNHKVSYVVDGKQFKNGTTNDNGILKISVSDGSHGIRMGNQQEVYIDNYAGIGIVEDNIRTYPKLTYLSDGSCDVVEETTEQISEETTVNNYNRIIGNSSPKKRDYKVNTKNSKDNIDDNKEKTLENDNNSEKTIIKEQNQKNALEIKITVGQNNISVNENSIKIDSPAYINDSSIMVPLRVLSEAINTNNSNNNEIKWDENLKTATIYYNGKTIMFKANSEYVIVDGLPIIINDNTKAEIKNNRMFIPFRVFADCIGIDVLWEPETKTAIYSVLS